MDNLLFFMQSLTTAIIVSLFLIIINWDRIKLIRFKPKTFIIFGSILAGISFLGHRYIFSLEVDTSEWDKMTLLMWVAIPYIMDFGLITALLKVSFYMKKVRKEALINDSF